VPTARLAGVGAVIGQGAGEERELLDESVQVFWNGAVPDESNSARALMAELANRGLLLEPFERALVGLREVYGEATFDDNVVD
jgi:hypothetical protein